MRFSIVIVLALFVSACAGSPTRTSQESAPAPSAPAQAKEPLSSRDLPVEEQNEKAFEIFQKMYEMSGTLSPEENLKMREEQYNRIIAEYPKAGLAQEGHWKLVRLYLREYNPPAVDKAEAVYKNFVTNYPQSFLIPEIEREMIRFYAKNQQWDQIIRFTAPIIREHGEKTNATPLFYYGESNYQLKRTDEAKRAFEIAVRTIPKASYLYKMAVDRLVELGGEAPAEDTGSQELFRRRRQH